jgi:RNA-binding protein YlmH
MSSEIYAHFHPDERPFVDKAWEWVDRAAQHHDMKRTDFLDPRQAHILMTLVNREGDVHLRLDGGYEAAERKRAIVAPDYRPLEHEDMGIQVLSVTSDDSQIQSLDHGDYMGAILGLGIKREKIGDIHVLENGCHCLAAAEIISFLDIHLQQVHRVRVQTEILPADHLEVSHVQLEQMNLSVASLRMDGIVSDVYRLSRAKVMIPIKAGRCRVNWKVEEDPSAPLNQGDTISLQGFGRFKVIEVEGVTKKGRYRVKVGKYV